MVESVQIKIFRYLVKMSELERLILEKPRKALKQMSKENFSVTNLSKY